jgi:hypothetical protein
VTRELVINKDLIAPREYAQIRSLIGKSVEGAKAEIKYTASPALARQTVPAPAQRLPLEPPAQRDRRRSGKPLRKRKPPPSKPSF